MNKQKKLTLIIVLGAVIFGFLDKNPQLLQDLLQTDMRQNTSSDQVLDDAYRGQKSDVQVSGTGRVIHILPDDTQGSRHQKFLLKLGTGQTLLVSHNIDVAPRINALRKGDTVEFNGEYEWNEKGGVLHWTHHDPAGRHEDGWLKHNGTTYQ